jgi:hypothetical protein
MPPPTRITAGEIHTQVAVGTAQKKFVFKKPSKKPSKKPKKKSKKKPKKKPKKRRRAAR